MKLDLGCGRARKSGFVGVDREPGEGVDHVVDLEREPLPFADRSVDEIFSSHCLEHLADQALVFHEISRVARDGARLEIWTPYAWTDDAFLYTHRTFFTEQHYLHPCVRFPEHWRDILGARWELLEFQYVVLPEVREDLASRGMDLEFALRHLKNVVVEFGTHVRIWHEGSPEVREPRRTVSATRDGPRSPVAASAGERAGGRGGNSSSIRARIGRLARRCWPPA